MELASSINQKAIGCVCGECHLVTSTQWIVEPFLKFGYKKIPEPFETPINFIQQMVRCFPTAAVFNLDFDRVILEFPVGRGLCEMATNLGGLYHWVILDIME